MVDAALTAVLPDRPEQRLSANGVEALFLAETAPRA